MKIEEGAILAGLDIRMRPALIAADALWRHYGQELVITSGLDGEHSAGSLHYYGRAVDMRSWYFGEDASEVAKILRQAIPDDFDVVFEGNHIHVEYDPKEQT